ncbi:MAG: hypothetical protein AB1403_17865, partial [Candidatus Riflebacteria bacterium]
KIRASQKAKRNSAKKINTEVKPESLKADAKAQEIAVPRITDPEKVLEERRKKYAERKASIKKALEEEALAADNARKKASDKDSKP